MNNLSQNINYLITHFGYTQALVAEKTGINKATINSITTGRSKDPQYFTLLALANFFGISIDVLMTGSPTDLIDSKKSSETKPLKNIIPILETNQIEDFLGWGKTPSKKIEVESSLNPRCFVIVYSGKAMFPLFLENTLVIIDPEVETKTNELVLALKDNEYMIRKLTMEGGQHFLIPENHAFPDLPLNKKDKIIGKVISTRNFFDHT